MAEITQSSGSNSARGKVRRKKSSTRIDMTPMVDLAFLLLTFFMLTTTFMKLYIIPIEKPADRGTSASPRLLKDEDVLTLVLGENNKIYWYHGTKNPIVKLTNYSGSGIRKVLFEKKAQIEGLHIFIKPTNKSKYKNMIDILDELLITEIKQYSLSKITPEDSRLIAESKL